MLTMETQVYAVEKIVGHRLLDDGTAEFLVKCVGIPDVWNTWQPLSKLRGETEALRRYNESFTAENPIRRRGLKRKREEIEDPADDVTIEYLQDLRVTQRLVKTTLTDIADNIHAQPLCVFCGEHNASELCTAYPTHKERMDLVLKEKRCKACGIKQHRRLKGPPCTPSIDFKHFCDFCGCKDHFQHMCEIFTEGFIDEYVKN